MSNYLRGGDLWQEITATNTSALATGALQSIPSRCLLRPIPQGDVSIDFQVRVVANLSRKSQAVKQRAVEQHSPSYFNPFLPYDPDLYVGELSRHYRCLLNKYNVMDHHALLVTREYVEQRAALNREDFFAAMIALQARDCLVFYNGGAEAGTSVQHKHLQVIPLPLGESESFPLAKLFAATISEGGDNSVNTLPFSHRIIATEFKETPSSVSIDTMVDSNFKRYQQLLLSLQLVPQCDGLMSPHNLLLTREWMWVVPRHRESYQGLAVNALAYAGTLLVKNQAQLSVLDRVGCLNLLRLVN